MPHWTPEEYNEWLRRKAAAKVVADTRRPWTDRELDIIKAACSDPTRPVDFKLLGEALNRSRYSVALKASRLGLGNFSRPKGEHRSEAQSRRQKAEWSELSPLERIAKSKQLQPYQGKTFLGKAHTEESKTKMSIGIKAAIAKNGHPRGMLGKHHIDETKRALSAAESGKKIPREQVIRAMQTNVQRYGSTALSHRSNASWKAKWVNVGGQRFYARSLWEANYARYLEFLKGRGEVLAWQHEPETFWFQGVKRGCVSYLPDFKVTLWTGSTEYHEVKGWMDARSKTKIKRMAKYHPTVTLIVVDAKRYRAIARNARGVIPTWEYQQIKTSGLEGTLVKLDRIEVGRTCDATNLPESV